MTDFMERHYTLAELGKAWHMSRTTVRSWFADEDGVIRYGAEKLPLMLNQRLLDKTCAEHGIVVNGAEVDAALARDLKGMAGMTLDKFVKTVLPKYKKNLYEWKEDILRPRLQMMRLVQDRLVVTPDEIRKAYESAYGADNRNAFSGYTYDAWSVINAAVPAALKKGQPGTPEFRQALRDSIENLKNVVGVHGIYSMSPEDHSGTDERARVMVKVEGGNWRLMP